MAKRRHHCRLVGLELRTQDQISYRVTKVIQSGSGPRRYPDRCISCDGLPQGLKILNGNPRREIGFIDHEGYLLVATGRNEHAIVRGEWNRPIEQHEQKI